MKPGIHPTWYPDAVITCACGNTWKTGSTKKEIHTDVCHKCHPFFTGEQRIVDTAGQVERFMKRINAKEQLAATQPAPEEKKAKKEKRRDRKGTTTISLTQTPEAPAELPLAEVEEKPVVEETVAPVAKVEEPVVMEAKTEEPAPMEMVEEPAPVAPAEPTVVEVPPVAQVEEPAPVVEVPQVEAKVEEPTPIVFEEPAPVAKVEEPMPVEVPQIEAKIEEPAPVVAVPQVEAKVEEPARLAKIETVPDDLTIIEGVGPKIASALNEAGIVSFKDLAVSSTEQLQDLLKSANLTMANPGTWVEQAKLAAAGKFDELKQWQSELVGGRVVEEAPAPAKKTAKASPAKKPAAKKVAVKKPTAKATKKAAPAKKASTTKKSKK